MTLVQTLSRKSYGSPEKEKQDAAFMTLERSFSDPSSFHDLLSTLLAELPQLSELQRNAKILLVKDFQGTKGIIQKPTVSMRPGNSLTISETTNQ